MSTTTHSRNLLTTPNSTTGSTGDSSEGATVARSVEFVCPSCGADRDGLHVHDPRGASWVQCNTCSYRCDPGVLEIPTEAVLAEWHAQAVRHSQTALRCADGTRSASYLAIVWCRRLAPELSLWGKAAFLDTVTRPLDGALTRSQREVVVELGAALRMPPTAINRVLDTI
ncbi:MAG: hypothetical protein ACLGHQ_05380 [Acidimicrobiia bacterium]